MNNIIAFANQKGGCGKSTHCLLFANYLAWKGENVCIVDTDIQQTLVLQRKDDMEFFEGEEPYSIQGFDVAEPAVMKKLMKNCQQFDGWVLIDCPGNMKEDGLIPVLTQSDYIVCPYRYDQKTLSSTGVFVKILQNLSSVYNCRIPILFLPNNINRKGNLEEKKMWRQVAEMFSMVGTVLDPVPSRVALERVNTCEITASQRDIVSKVYDNIINIINK